jgi:hypothetical protein
LGFINGDRIFPVYEVAYREARATASGMQQAGEGVLHPATELSQMLESPRSGADSTSSLPRCCGSMVP